ncbi:mucin-13 isoform X4 [Denticeps clupeoides]|uniref:mucin-13 isoform X4 n=1 Tax=Denticeps clupeoides TaxID=299321 RepID=UPI0010A3289F|nr:mucin-13-like isoform X4 [Denticeps clupeoides]
MSPRPLLLALLLTLRSCADGDAILQASNVTSETFSSTDIKAVSTDGATPTNITNSANSIVLGSSTIQATTNMVTLTSTRQAVTSVITPTSITEAATDVVMSSKITQATTSMDIATNTTGSVSSMVSHNTEEKISSSLNSTPNNQLIQRSTEPGGVSTNQGTATLASDSISVITKTFGTSGATSAQVPDSSTSGNGSQGTDLTTESHSSHVTPSEPVGQETSIDSRSTRSSATISGHDYNTEISAMVSLSTDEKTSSFFSSSPTHRLTRETTQDKITIDQGSGNTVQSTVNTTLAANPSSTEVQSTVKSTVPTLGQSTKSISTAAKPTENITTTTIQQTVNMTSTTVTSTQSATTLQPTVSSTINTTTVPPTFSVTSESSSTTKFQTIITTFRPTANSTMNATTTTSRPTVSSTVNATTTTSRPMISSTVNATTTTSRPTISSTMNATITTSRPMISSTVNATTTTPRPTVNSTVYATTTTFRPTVNSTVNATTTTSGPMVNFTSTFEPTKSPPADFCTTCPLGSSCVNLTCQCLPGTYFNNQTQTCENARVFSGELHINSSFQADMANQSSQQFKDMAGKITNALQKALRGQPGYVSSSVLQLRQGSVVATVVNAFQINSDATDESTASAIKQAIEACTGNCDTVFSQADFTAIPLCSLSPGPCQVETTVCASQDGKPKCTCRDGFIRNEYSQKSCTACPPGQQAAGDVCVACPFGYSGFNCNDSALLAVVVISCVLGGTLLILVLGLLLYFCVTCRRTNKNQDYDSPYTSEDLRGSWPTQGVVSIPRASANPNPAFQNSGSMLEMTAAGSTHSLVDNRGGTNGMFRKIRSKTGSYDVNPPEDMRTFKSQTPSRYSYLVQGHENPYFLPGDERRST